MLTAGVTETHTNLALNKPAYQSSTRSSGVPGRAVGMNLIHVF